MQGGGQQPQQRRAVRGRHLDAHRRHLALFHTIMNADPASVAFKLPSAQLNGRWRLIFDTARPDQMAGEVSHPVDKPYNVAARSCVLLHDA